MPLELLEVKHSHSPDHFDETLGGITPPSLNTRRSFAQSERLFAALSEERQDKPSALMVERCRELVADPPAEGTGAYQLKTK